MPAGVSDFRKCFDPSCASLPKHPGIEIRPLVRSPVVSMPGCFPPPLPREGGVSGRDWPVSGGCAVAHVAARVATCGDCGVPAHRTSYPPKLPLSPPKLSLRSLCLCFHETCANQSDVEKTAWLLGFLRVAFEFAVRSERSRTRAFRTRVSRGRPGHLVSQDTA
jgi:hypothetical protein